VTIGGYATFCIQSRVEETEMDDDPVEQVVNELFPYFEALEARSAAILQLLKDKGLTTDEQFAPYLEQAGNGSNVKWLAARIRVQRLLSSKVKAEKEKDLAKEEEAKTKQPSAEETPGTSAEQNSEQDSKQDSEQSAQQNKEERSASKSTEPDARKSLEKPREQVSQNTADSDANQPAKKLAGQDTRNEITQASDKNINSKDSGARDQANTVPNKREEKKSQ
jgi:hypothetical protein